MEVLRYLVLLILSAPLKVKYVIRMLSLHFNIFFSENDMLRNLAISRLVKRAPSEDDMLRNLAISRLVKRSPYLGLDSKRAPYSGRRMAISRLIKKNREAAVPEYDVADLLSDIYSDDYIPQRIVKDADTSKFSALWKTRVGK